MGESTCSFYIVTLFFINNKKSGGAITSSSASLGNMHAIRTQKMYLPYAVDTFSAPAFLSASSISLLFSLVYLTPNRTDPLAMASS